VYFLNFNTKLKFIFVLNFDIVYSQTLKMKKNVLIVLNDF